MNTHDESQRGHEARRLMENPLYREAIDSMREGIVQKWRSAPIRDREGMHELKLMDKLLSDLEAYIRQIAETGKMADIQLEKEANMNELRKKSGFR